MADVKKIINYLLICILSALFALMIGWDVYDFFVTNQGVSYYSSSPGKLMYAILSGIAIGGIIFGISRFPIGLPHKLKLAAIGIFATLVTAIVGYAAYNFTWKNMVEMKIDICGIELCGVWGWTAIFLAVVAGVGSLWFEFYIALKHMPENAKGDDVEGGNSSVSSKTNKIPTADDLNH